MRDDVHNLDRCGVMLPACRLYPRDSGKGASYLMGCLDRPNPAPRLTLPADLAVADGDPRICIAWPGRAGPVAFSTLVAAIATLREVEGRDAGH